MSEWWTAKKCVEWLHEQNPATTITIRTFRPMARRGGMPPGAYRFGGRDITPDERGALPDDDRRTCRPLWDAGVLAEWNALRPSTRKRVASSIPGC